MPRKDPVARSEYHKQYMRGWYQKNKEKHVKYVKTVQDRKTIERREFIDNLKNNPCLDCGNRFPPECMDFDHLSDKKFDIGRGFSRVSMKNLLEELKKCELVCANCHRTRTRKRSSGDVVE